ncbi:LacI family DNA-binding transcriptional regulator [Arthrobacter bambusae]|uniref:LacI family transcriptional regulator n=1 Tax=Arthrobacter bambusae TaxID=1338426 RepID=A0AAW8DFI6_9MICC|nr:LacI family DNA-binding transcriptional regulator [Arthrobacter bambusae]MDP9904662.1 LacI family transcriptional regulator [Arthrobacter bambusae]MDQ0129478.1 LacI family transcriptional regulator [Arthrobacter bambusae]MDQ0180909.1 LacI family transcriptional regulator [Arthrobacter bambusae]
MPLPSRPRRSGKPTMMDVGRLAGVSQSTVSHVVNRTGKIPPETEKRVREAIGNLGFQPNETARNLRLKRSHTIGLVTDGIASSPLAGRVLLGAEEFAWENGYLLLLVDAERNSEIESAAVDTLLARQVDGMLYAALSWREVELPENFSSVPSLLINAWPSPAREVPAIVPAEVEGGRAAARAVIEMGHRRIAFLGGPPQDPARIEREIGFREALTAAGIPVNGSWILSGDYEIRSGHALTHGILDQAAPPTALVCGNDRMAVGAITAALERGLRIPADVSIVGYDDQENLADQVLPALTTVSIPHYEMGRVAVMNLLDALASGKAPAGAVVPGMLIRRDSVSNPKPA